MGEDLISKILAFPCRKRGRVFALLRSLGAIGCSGITTMKVELSYEIDQS
jgi:hypothetical protein